MKRHLYKLLTKTLFALLLTTCLSVLAMQVQAKLLDRIVAVVESDVIMESELRQRLAVLVKQFEVTLKLCHHKMC